MSALTIKITRPAVERRSAAGKAYFVQSGVSTFIGRDGHPEEVQRRIEFLCESGYPAGEYEISPASFGVGQYDKLEIRRLVLTPKGASAQEYAATAKK